MTTQSVDPVKTQYLPISVLGKAPAPGKRLWFVLACTAVAVILGVVLLEFLFKVCGVGEQIFLMPDTELGCKHIPNKMVTWRVEGFSHGCLSSAGLRDTEHSLLKQKRVYRIALLGDSWTEALQVPMERTYGKVLESMLNASVAKGNFLVPKNVREPEGSTKRDIQHFEVINFGCSSYSTGQEWLQYRKQVLNYQPDAIILFFNRNDASENIAPSKVDQSIETRPYFYLDSQGKLAIDERALQYNADKLKVNPIISFLRNHSRIFGVFAQADLSLTLFDSRYRRLKKFIDSLQLAWRPQKTISANYLPQNEMAVTIAILQQFAAEASAKHQTLVLLTPPILANDPALNQQIAQLQSFAKQNQIELLDSTGVLAHSIDPLSNFLQYHLSEKGHKLVAEALYKHFKQLVH